MIDLSVKNENGSITFNFGDSYSETIVPNYNDIAVAKYFVNRLIGFENATRKLSFKNPHIINMLFTYTEGKLECVIMYSNYVKKINIDKQSAIKTFTTLIVWFNELNKTDETVETVKSAKSAKSDELNKYADFDYFGDFGESAKSAKSVESDNFVEIIIPDKISI